MSVSRYNRIFNFSLVIVVLYNILCVADLILSSADLGSIIKYSAAFYLIFAVVTLICKIQFARKYFLACAIPNCVVHLVLTIVSFILVPIIVL